MVDELPNPIPAKKDDVEGRRRALSGESLPPTPQLVVDYDNLKFHKLAGIERMMTAEELKTLEDSVAKDGIWQHMRPWLYQGEVIIGRNRCTAAKNVGLKLAAKDFNIFTGTPEQAEDFVWQESNRRNLTSEDKQDKIKKADARWPHYSDRKIGRICGVDKNTVKAVREKLKAVAEDDVDRAVKEKKALNAHVNSWEDLSDANQKAFVQKYRGELQELIG